MSELVSAGIRKRARTCGGRLSQCVFGSACNEPECHTFRMRVILKCIQITHKCAAHGRRQRFLPIYHGREVELGE